LYGKLGEPNNGHPISNVRLPHLVFYILSPVSCLLSSVFCLLYSVFCLLRSVCRNSTIGLTCPDSPNRRNKKIIAPTCEAKMQNSLWQNNLRKMSPVNSVDLAYNSAQFESINAAFKLFREQFETIGAISRQMCKYKTLTPGINPPAPIFLAGKGPNYLANFLCVNFLRPLI
jgi:hypothetical protein